MTEDPGAITVDISIDSLIGLLREYPDLVVTVGKK